MPIKIILTKDPLQIDAIFKIRHSVFSEEIHAFASTADKRLFDRFDTYPDTHNLVVLTKNNEVVGGMRLTLDSAIGLPADEYYDFRRYLPKDSRVINAGMYCVTKEYRSSRIAMGLMLMASYFGISQGVTHVVAPVNPMIAKLLERVGFKALDKEITEPNGLVILPMLLDTKELGDFFVKFIKNNNLHNFISSYECLFYQKGEEVIRTGDKADSAFVIVEGEIEVRAPNSGDLLANMGVGEVFGELALLTDDIRCANVVALTDLRIMSLPKTEFLNHLQHHPENAMIMLKNIGGRLKHMLEISRH